ncbi:glutamate ligase domain-containing protein [Alienimonas sp. DA493]|uniref:glutamate ligase domain-containing protein n=1 Tax=Alienimonas sp. DA493 TaxID=3373605 RepID=UPI003754ED05
MLDPFSPGRVFCVGAAGSGVRAMAELLHGFGWQVSGTDRGKPDVLGRMRAKGLAVAHDPDGNMWDERPDLLLFSPAVPPTDPARQRAEIEGVPQATHIDLLAELTKLRETIAVAGTHGKSGTAALLVHLLRCSGRRVAGFVGAEPVDPTYSFADPDPELLVVEACEWNRHFLRLEPRHAVITGVEFDHPDSYRDEAELIGAFRRFVERVPIEGTVVSEEKWRRWASEGRNAVVRFHERTPERSGPRPDGVYDVGLGGGVTFETREWVGNEQRSAMPSEALSRHNVAFAVVAAAEMGVDLDDACIWTNWPHTPVPMLRRRFEIVGEWRGRTVVDDYAHHPSALRDLYWKNMFFHWDGFGTGLVFQPHQCARTEALFDRFAAALQQWENAAVLPVFPARETATAEQCTALSRRLAEASGATFLPDLDALPRWADDSTRPGDALVLAGAGDIDRARDLLFPGARPSPGTRPYSAA